MAFPSTGILDSGIRPDQGPPPSADWTNFAAPGLSGNPGLAILNNQFVGQDMGGSIRRGSAYWSRTTFYADQEVFANGYFDWGGEGPGDSELGFFLRLTNPGLTADAYLVTYLGEFETFSLQIYKYIGGVVTALDGTSFSPPFPLAGDIFGATIVGNTITAYVAGAPVFQINDSSITTPGYIGMLSINSADQLQSEANFGGGTIPGLVVPTAKMRSRRTSW